jgi:alpha-L-fucosidase
VPPDPSGRIHAQDSAALVSFGQKLRDGFDTNLLKGRKRETLTPRCLFVPKRIVGEINDGDRSTYERINQDRFGGPVVQFDLRRKKRFNTILLREYIAEGQRVQSFKVEAKRGKNWEVIAESKTIGARKIIQFSTIKARRIRVTILEARDMPLLSEVELYRRL